MAEELEVKLQVDSEEGKSKLDEFAKKLGIVTSGVKAVQKALAGDPKKDLTFGTQARSRVQNFTKAVDEAGQSTERAVRARTKDRKPKEEPWGDDAVKEVEEMTASVNDLTESTEGFLEKIDKAETGETFFDKETLKEMDELNTQINTLTTNATGLQYAMKKEGVPFGEDAPEDVKKLEDEVGKLEALVVKTKDAFTKASDGEVFGKNEAMHVKKLEDTLRKAEAKIAKSKEKIGQPPKGGFPVKVSEQVQELAGVVGDLMPRQLQMMKRGFDSATRGTQSFTKGMKGLKKALISSGIGALVVLLGELVANWDDIVGSLNSASDATNKLVEDSEKELKVAQERSRYLKDNVNTLLLQGKTMEDIEKMQEEALDNEIEQARIRRDAIKKQGEEQEANAEKNAERAQLAIKALTAPVQFLLKAIDEVTAGLASWGLLENATNLQESFNESALSGLGFDVEDMKKQAEEANKEADQALAELEERRAQNIVRRREEERKERERIAKAQKQFLDDLLKEEQEYGKTQDELAVMRLKREQETQIAKAKEIKLGNAELKRLEEQHAREMEDLLKEQEQRRAEIVEEEKQKVLDATKSDEQLQIDRVNEQYDELVRLAEKYGMDTVELEAKRQAELKAIQMKAQDDTLENQAKLRRELELLAMEEAEARFARMRDDATRELEERLVTAGGNLELEKMIRQQFQVEMQAINDEEKDHYLATRMEMFNSMMDFVGQLHGVYNDIQNLVRANMEAEMLSAKERGATDEELARIEQQHIEREKRLAITNVLLQQGQAIASAIAGASQASLATGALAPFTLPAYIATAVGSIVAGFVQVKNIMNKAKAQTLSTSQGGGGGGGRSATQALTPNLVTDLGVEDKGAREKESFKTYVVASDVQGENADYGSIVQNASL